MLNLRNSCPGNICIVVILVSVCARPRYSHANGSYFTQMERHTGRCSSMKQTANTSVTAVAGDVRVDSQKRFADLSPAKRCEAAAVAERGHRHTQSTVCWTATMMRLMHTVASAAMRPRPVALWL